MKRDSNVNGVFNDVTVSLIFLFNIHHKKVNKQKTTTRRINK